MLYIDFGWTALFVGVCRGRYNRFFLFCFVLFCFFDSVSVDPHLMRPTYLTAACGVLSFPFLPQTFFPLVFCLVFLVRSCVFLQHGSGWVRLWNIYLPRQRISVMSFACGISLLFNRERGRSASLADERARKRAGSIPHTTNRLVLWF